MLAKTYIVEVTYPSGNNARYYVGDDISKALKCCKNSIKLGIITSFGPIKPEWRWYPDIQEKHGRCIRDDFYPAFVTREDFDLI